MAVKTIMDCEQKFKCPVHASVAENSVSIAKMRRDLEEENERSLNQITWMFFPFHSSFRLQYWDKRSLLKLQNIYVVAVLLQLH